MHDELTSMTWAFASQVGRSANAIDAHLDHCLLASMLESLPALVYFKDIDGRYLRVSQRYVEIAGRTDVAEMIGRTDEELGLPSEFADQLRADEQLLVSGAVPLIDKEEAVVGYKRTRWFKSTKYAIRDERGRAIGTFGVSLDITERREAEREARESRDAAEALNAEMAEVLNNLAGAQAELLQSRNLESIGQLAAGVAHEINTPIQFIADNTRFVGSALDELLEVVAIADELAAEADTVPELQPLAARYCGAAEAADLPFIISELPAAIEQTIDGTRRVSEIVHALKEFAYPSLDEKVDTDLNRVVNATVAVSKSEWKLVADVHLSLDPDLPQVPALVGPLHQVLLIIVVNAAQAIAEQHTDGTKGNITVITSHDEECVEVIIGDDGPGMTPAIAERIFEPFFTTKAVGTGSGQGLSIARSVVVKRHGGTITVDTAPGHGTTFHIRLPLVDRES